jgi:quercetin dioxygenase-like cupin family protein
VLTRNTLPYVKHVSHVIFSPGSKISGHAHADGAEVFYCIRGKAAFSINGETVVIMKGHLLIIEPGELHSIDEIIEETELLYFYTNMKK